MIKPMLASQVDPGSIVSKASCAQGVELLVRDRAPGHVILKGGHKEHLLMCTRGKPVSAQTVHSKLVTEDEQREWHTCPSWHITFIPAGLPMEWQWSYLSQSLHLTIEPDFLTNVQKQISAEKDNHVAYRPLFRVADNSLRTLLHQLKDESKASDLGTDLVTSSLLNQISVNLFRLGEYAEKPEKSTGLSKVACLRCLALINDRLEEKIPLSDLAKEANLSSFHFSRLFKQTMGYPPHEYQIRQRVKKAEELLINQPSRSIADIGCELGFADESHFRRHFKRITGRTPGQLRN